MPVIGVFAHVGEVVQDHQPGQHCPGRFEDSHELLVKRGMFFENRNLAKAKVINLTGRKIRQLLAKRLSPQNGTLADLCAKHLAMLSPHFTGRSLYY